MKKTFPFEHPKHAPARVVAIMKGDVRKYLKRERRKKLPEGVDFWDFDCRTGPDEPNAEAIDVTDLIAAIDRGSEAGWTEIYIEILAKPGHRHPKFARKKDTASSTVASGDSEPSGT